jgi:hypothetical protein
MSETEEDLLRDEVARIYNELALTADVLESAERHLGPSNWDFEGTARRAAPAVGDAELNAGEMRQLISAMRSDLESALEPLIRYKQDENATRATIMLGFMLNGRIKRIREILELN